MELNPNKNKVKLSRGNQPGLNFGKKDLTNLAAREIANKSIEKDESMGYLTNMPIEFFLTSRQRKEFNRMSAAKQEKIIAKIEKKIDRKIARSEAILSDLSDSKKKPLNSTGKMQKTRENLAATMEKQADIMALRKDAVMYGITSKTAKERLEKRKSKHIAKKERNEKLAKQKIALKDVKKTVAYGVGNAVLAEQGKNNEQMKELIDTAYKAKTAPMKLRSGIRGVSTVGRGMVMFSRAIVNALKTAAAAAAPFLLIFAVIMIFVVSFLTIFMDDEDENENLCPYGNMYYWIYWETGTWEPIEAYQCISEDGNAYGIQFDRRYTLTQFVKSCYDSDKEKYSMFEPYYGKTIAQNDSEFAEAWKQAYARNGVSFGNLQKQFVYDYYYVPAEEALKDRGIDISKRSEVVKGAVMSYAWHAGWETAAKNIANNANIASGNNDRGVIEKIYNERIKSYSAFSTRLTAEKTYAIELLDGGILAGGVLQGEEFEAATYQQKLVAQLALSKDTYSLNQGWCQKWVATTYQKALGGSYSSSCCATSAADKWIVSKSDKIPIGATVYGAHSWGGVGCTSCGKDAGHVGIYVGNGKIANLAAGYALTDFQGWMITYGYRGWGWNGGVPLN